jgi:hypothetical protein
MRTLAEKKGAGGVVAPHLPRELVASASRNYDKAYLRELLLFRPRFACGHHSHYALDSQEKTTGPEHGGAGSANASVTFLVDSLWRGKHAYAPQENAFHPLTKIAFAKQDVLP